MTEVTVSTYFRDEALACSTQSRALSCHLIFLWKSMARFHLFWGGFINLLERKGRDTQGYGVKIMKLNEKLNGM
jgi:hypothetical protein